MNNGLETTSWLRFLFSIPGIIILTLLFNASCHYLGF